MKRRGVRRGACGMALLLAAMAPAAVAQDKPAGAVAAADGSAEELQQAAFDLYQAGRHAEAEPLWRQAIDAFERQYGADYHARWNAIGILGNTISLAGRAAEAVPLMVEVLAHMERTTGPDSIDTLRAANNLAVTYWSLGRLVEAEPLFARALAGRERLLGPDDPATLMVVPNLANVYNSQDRFVEAEALYRRGVESSRRVLGTDHPDTAGAVSNLGGFYKMRGRYEEAEPLLLEALADSERNLGAEHPNTLNYLNSAADLYRQWRRFDRAEPMFVRLIDARTRVLGADHPGTQFARSGLAWIWLETGRLAEAEVIATQVYDFRQRLLGPDSPDNLSAAELLASVRLGQPGRAAEALAPARALLARTRARRSGGATDRAAEAQRARVELQGVGQLALVADAAWAAAEAGREPRAALQVEAFAALQESMASPAGRSIARMAVRRYADRAGAGLGDLVRERESLDGQWLASQNAFAATFAGNAADGEARRTAIAARSAGIEARMAEIDARLGRDFPDYFALVRPAPLDQAAAQRLLAADEAILMVVPTPYGTHAMAVTRDSVEWTRSALDTEAVDAIVQRLRWDLGAQVSVPEDQLRQWQAEAAVAAAGPTFDRAAAYRLHQELVAPLAATLAGKTRLYVAAAGPLAGLPFSVLVAEPPRGADGDPAALRETAWFADRHALVHIPSIQSLALLRQQARPAPGRGGSGSDGFVGVGDPVLDGAAATRGRSRGGTRAPDPAVLFARGATRS
ncbi:MAG: tetratricopeptide repeat protein, partial [Allosphingosinicella sp.]